MAPSHLHSEDFWQFSLQVYTRPAMKDICISLQNEQGADVNLLLLGLFLQANQVTLTSTEFDALLRLSDHWQQKTLKPLRERRIALEKGSEPYKAALAEELEAEKHEQAALIACWNSQVAALPGDTACRTELLDHYAAPLGLDPSDLLARMQEVKSYPP